jgi:hypothetical protein
MPWWKLDHHFRLSSYYLGFAATVPPSAMIAVAVLKFLFSLSTPELVLSWALLSGTIVLAGPPLLHWAHKTSLRTGSPRPLILAVDLMLLCGITPFGYFLIRQNGFDLWPLLGTSLVLLLPLVLLYCWPPKQIADRVQAGLKKIAES